MKKLLPMLIGTALLVAALAAPSGAFWDTTTTIDT